MLYKRSSTTIQFIAVVGCILLSWSSVQSQSTSFLCNICGSGLELGNPDGIVALDGREDRTCAELQEFGKNGFITEEQCMELIPLVEIPCDCQPFVCPICGIDGYMTEPGGIIDIPQDEEGLTTCAAVEAAANMGQFDEVSCITIQSLTLDPCGCEVLFGNHSTPTRSPLSSPTTTTTIIPPPSASTPVPPSSPRDTDAANGRIFMMTTMFYVLAGSGSQLLYLLLC